MIASLRDYILFAFIGAVAGWFLAPSDDPVPQPRAGQCSKPMAHAPVMRWP